MAQVKKNKNDLQAGTSSVGKASASTDSKSEIVAMRNGVKRTFSRLTFDFLPLNRDGSRDGWVEVSETPSSPKLKIVNTDDDAAKALKDAREKYLSVFEVEAEDDATVETIEQDIEEQRLLNEGGGTEGFVDFVIDQDYLDTHPDIAEMGKKVGDVIKVAPEPDAEPANKTIAAPVTEQTPAEKRKATIEANKAKALKDAEAAKGGK